MVSSLAASKVWMLVAIDSIEQNLWDPVHFMQICQRQLNLQKDIYLR